MKFFHFLPSEETLRKINWKENPCEGTRARKDGLKMIKGMFCLLKSTDYKAENSDSSMDENSFAVMKCTSATDFVTRRDQILFFFLLFADFIVHQPARRQKYKNLCQLNSKVQIDAICIRKINCKNF